VEWIEESDAPEAMVTGPAEMAVRPTPRPRGRPRKEQRWA